jgi:hypothetical protein
MVQLYNIVPQCIDCLLFIMIILIVIFKFGDYVPSKQDPGLQGAKYLLPKFPVSTAGRKLIHPTNSQPYHCSILIDSPAVKPHPPSASSISFSF